MLSLAGIVLASYLTWVHFDSSSLICGLGDCHTVQASEFATVGPIPVAMLGLAMYLTILACHLIMLLWPETRFMATVVAFAVALSGLVYAAYLTWIEVAVIDAICQWCVASAVLTLILALIEGVLLWRALTPSTTGQGETEARDAAY